MAGIDLEKLAADAREAVRIRRGLADGTWPSDPELEEALGKRTVLTEHGWYTITGKVAHPASPEEILEAKANGYTRLGELSAEAREAEREEELFRMAAGAKLLQELAEITTGHKVHFRTRMNFGDGPVDVVPPYHREVLSGPWQRLADLSAEARGTTARVTSGMTDTEVDAAMQKSWEENTARRRALGRGWHTTRWELFGWMLKDAWAFCFGRKP